MSVLCVIPVRGGSKRVPRKWAQLVDGRPLLQTAIDCARNVRGFDGVVVCTEDQEIAAYARLRGVLVIPRPVELAADDVPIAEVVRFVADETRMETGTIVVLQPTCPLLTPDTVEAMLKEFHQTGYSWAITTTKDPHIFHQHGVPIVPRVNSQKLAEFSGCLERESGAVQMMTVDFLRRGGGLAGTYPIDPVEAIDIDTWSDLEAARAEVSRRTILFHVLASDEKGSGHLRRCLQLSEALGRHRVIWATNQLESWALVEAMRRGIEVTPAPFDQYPDLVVVDALEAAETLVPRYASEGIPTVLFEHDGRAAKFADMVVDEFDMPSWTILRPEFLCLPPYRVREKADQVLVTFGGTDPTGMNERVSRIVRHGADAVVHVRDRGLTGSMAEAMRNADLVITSQGRTVHEAAAVGVPCLSIAVNERESRHAQLPGVVYMGLSACISDSLILDTVNRLLGSHSLRSEMSRTASESIDGKGLGRVVRAIEGLLHEHA